MDSTAAIVPEDPALTDKLVLVVEDDSDLRQTIQWMLEDEGFLVETAADGREALDRATQRKPSLVILDMGLPIIDGNGVAAGLRSTYGNNVTILTMTADGRAAEKAQRIGAIGFLSKPFDLDALVNAVRSALNT
ncbi:MAG: response regulator transcription factor [Ktedonobacteraceae bacterium]|nr:response regulator transcription factor [Ktedonobacteraceae bacterium]